MTWKLDPGQFNIDLRCFKGKGYTKEEHGIWNIDYRTKNIEKTRRDRFEWLYYQNLQKKLLLFFQLLTNVQEKDIKSNCRTKL